MFVVAHKEKMFGPFVSRTAANFFCNEVDGPSEIIELYGTKESMIERIVENLEKWMKTDKESFLYHVKLLEKKYLTSLTYEEVRSIFIEDNY